MDIGKGYIVNEGNDIAILNLGTRLESCLEACSILKQRNVYPTLADARFAKPLDTNLIDKLIDNHKFLITIEEGSIGGFASQVSNYINNIRLKRSSVSVKNLFFPDKFIEHMLPNEQYEEMNMDTNSIVQTVSKLYDDKIIEIKNYNKN